MLQCSGAGKTADCLSAAQVGALKDVFGGPRNSAGQALYAPQPWDPGLRAPGWRQWTLGDSTTALPNSRYNALMVDALVNEFFTPPDPAFDPLRFDFDRDPGRMSAFSAIYDTDFDASLTAFEKRGGKLLFVHGMADPIFSADDTIAYYERLVANHGGVAATQDFSRLFLVPGMNHCSGGPATDMFDSVQAMVDWVEKGIAPERIRAVAQPTSAYFPNRRPTAVSVSEIREVQGHG